MGWLWSSSTKSEDKPNDEPSKEKRDFSLTDEQKARILGRAGFTPKPTASKDDASSSRDAKADAELDEFLRSFSAAEIETPPLPELVDGITPTKPREPSVHDRIRPDGSLNIHPSAIYPRTMSCRAAFDQAYYCQSPGGKFNDIYRFGHLKDCSEQWGAFWFCMRTRTWEDERKQEAIRQYYEERAERKKKAHGSSENIWDLRTTPVERAFDKDPDAGELRKELVKD